MVTSGQVPGLSDSTLQVRLDAIEAGWFSGEVSVNSNDPDRPLFTLNLSGRVLSPDGYSDLDGMNDAAELALSALGFLWNSRQAALVDSKFQSDGWGDCEASMGRTRASRVVFGALAKDLRFRPFHVVFDEGVENNTRGRVCSPRFHTYGASARIHFYRTLVTTFYENVGLVGFHAEREIMDLQWKSSPPLMEASGNTIWMPLEMAAPSAPSTPWLSPENVRQTAGQALDISVLLPAGKRFVRLMRR